MQTRPAPAFDLAAIFALSIRPAPAPAFGRAMRALDTLEEYGLDLFDLDPTARANCDGFDPAARQTIRP